MSKILEALVARGRRARNPREQREVALGLAEQSTQKELHDRLYKKGGIGTLLSLLQTSSDPEAQRLSALAIANCVSTAQCRCSLVQEELTLLSSLIDYIDNDERDPQGRNYCAMAIGNLAAEAENHGEIVKLGAIEAVLKLLRSYPKNAEAGRFGAFALSNLAAVEKYQQRIVDSGAMEILVALACTDSRSTQHWSLATLRGICSNPQHRAMAVKQGILDPLVLMARADQVEVLREVSAAFNCLSAAEENKREMADRVLSTVLALLLSGDKEVERHACSTIANLIEMVDIHDRFLEERGLPPIVALAVSSTTDEKCKGEAARAIANLSANADIQYVLIRERVVEPMVEALRSSDVNCKRFAALCIANLATSALSQVKIVQGGAVQPLLAIINESDSHMEAKRYAALAMANLSASHANHQILTGEEGLLDALFSFTNSPDLLSKYYLSCTLANFVCNTQNHEWMVLKGGLQQIIALASSADFDTQRQAAAALRRLSPTDEISIKIVQEGGLEPLEKILATKVDVEILREVTACMCNLSLSDKNKFEIAKCGAVSPLIANLQSDDMLISVQCCSCLASLAETVENQLILFKEGCIQPCIEAMRSPYLEVQRESSRLLANMCANSNAETIDTIVKDGGHQLLISFLLSQDHVCQKMGAFGTGNLCVQQPYRALLVRCGATEPLCSLARSENIDIEIRRSAMLAIANLAYPEENHALFLEQKVPTILVSMCSVSDSDLRQYAAYAVANLAKNADTRDDILKEGAVESVLFLAKTLEPEMQHIIIAAVANLSFSEEHKKYICRNGGLSTIAATLCADGTHVSKLASCALANLSEFSENLELIVGSGLIELSLKLLQMPCSQEVRSEAFRALGNLSACPENGEIMMKDESFLRIVFTVVKEGHSHCDSRRMAFLVLSNLAANVKNHSLLLRKHAVDPLLEDFRAALDEKDLYDNETVQFGLLAIANLSSCHLSHLLIMNFFLETLTRFTKHRDIKCRQYSVLAVGNLCSNYKNFDRLVEVGCVQILISYSFPSASDFSTSVRTQAIAGLRGLATHAVYRLHIMKDSGVEPLILAVTSSRNRNCVDLQREAAATFRNLALGYESGFSMIQNGVLPTLIELSLSDDSECQHQALLGLASLAELESKSQILMLEAGCLCPLLRVADSRSSTGGVREAAIRCISLFSCSVDSHSFLLRSAVAERMGSFIRDNEDDIVCRRYVSLAVANFAVLHTNHQVLLDSSAVAVVLSLAKSTDMDTRRSVAFMLNGIATNTSTHIECVKLGVPKVLASLLSCSDLETQIQSCICARHLCINDDARLKFIEAQGLPAVFALSRSESIEIKREAAAALRNISIDYQAKTLLVKNGGIHILAELSRLEDLEVSHQACGVIANLSEAQENLDRMVSIGVLQHLKYAWRSTSIDVRREVLRALANIVSDSSLIDPVINAGAVAIFLAGLSLPDLFCRRFAVMGVANIATKIDIQGLLLEDNFLNQIFSIVREDKPERQDPDTLRNAVFSVSSLAASEKNHSQLIKYDIIKIVVYFLNSSDNAIQNSAMLCLANLSSNYKCYDVLSHNVPIESFNVFLHSSDKQFLVHAVRALKGLSVNDKMRCLIIECHLLPRLLKLALSSEGELQRESVGALCNLSISGCFRDLPTIFIGEFSVSALVSFLESNDQLFQLFAALALGNIANEESLYEYVLQSGALIAMVSAFKRANVETRRQLSRALCNLAATESGRLSLFQSGGLLPIMYLAGSTNCEDMKVGLGVLRGLAAFAESRRTLVEVGILGVISHGIKGDKDCQLEAVASLRALSMNDDNKHDIMTSVAKDALELAGKSDQDQSCCQLVIETLANLSEDGNLHMSIIHEFDGVNFLLELAQKSGTKVLQELSRFFANLASTKSSHGFLYKVGALPFFTHLCSSQDTYCRRYALIGLFNLFLEVTTDEVQKFVIDIPSILASIMKNAVKSDPLSCRYAILAFGALAIKCEYLETNFDPISYATLLAEDMIETEDLETRLYTCYALNKLSSSEKMVKIIDSDIMGPLVKLLVHAPDNRHICAYSVSALRKLCFYPRHRKAMVDKGGIAALVALTCKADPDIIREISACFLYISLTKDLVLSLIASRALHSDQIFLLTQDIETLRMALGAMANMAEDVTFQAALTVDSAFFSILSSTIKNRSVAVHRESCRVLSNVLSCEAAHKLLKEEIGLAKLSFLAKSADRECKLNVALCFWKLALNYSNHDELMADGYTQTIFELARCRDVDIRRLAVSTLLALSRNETYKVNIAQRDGLNAAIGFLADDDLLVKLCAVDILHQFSLSNRLKIFMVQENIAEVLLKYANKDSQVALVGRCITVLANLSSHRENHCKLFESGVLLSLVDFANNDCDSRIQNDIATIFCFLSSHPKHLDGAFGVHIVKAMLHLVSFHDNNCSWISALALGNLADSDENKKMIISCDGIEPIAALLQETNSEKCRSASLRVLRKIALLEMGVSCIIKADAMSSLVMNIRSSSVDVKVESSMLLCNLSTSLTAHDIFATTDGIQPLVTLLSDTDGRCRELSAMCLCNYSKLPKCQMDIAKLGGVLVLINLTKSDGNDGVKYALMALCNMSANREIRRFLLRDGILDSVRKLLDNFVDVEIRRVLVAIVYNLSSSAACHADIFNASILPAIHVICKTTDIICRRYALMVMCNLSSNSLIRKSVTSGGGLHSAIILLESQDFDIKRYACACLINMSNNSVTQSMIVVHGGLPSLMKLANDDSAELQFGAIVCLGNIAANESNHFAMLHHGALELLVKMCSTSSSTLPSAREAATFALCNFTVNKSVLNVIGKVGGIRPLLHLMLSNNNFYRCLASSAIRCLSYDRENWELMCQEEVLSCIVSLGKNDDIEITRNIAACFCNLSLGEENRTVVAAKCITEIIALSKMDDGECRRQSIGAIANLAEAKETHEIMKSFLKTKDFIGFPCQQSIDVNREISRALSNLLATTIFHDDVLAAGELASIFDLAMIEDSECQYHVSRCLRKLSSIHSFQQVIVQSGLVSLFALLNGPDYNTKKHAATALRQLCEGDNIFKEHIAYQGGIDAALGLAKVSKNELQLLGIASLRHLSNNSNLKRVLVEKGALEPCVSYAPWASEELQRQIASLLANLSEHGENQGHMVACGVTQSVLSLVHSKDTLVKQDCSRTLANLSSSEQNQIAVYRHGALDCFLSLAGSISDVICQRYSAIGIRFLVSNPEVRRNILADRTILSFGEMASSDVVYFKQAVAASYASLSLEVDSRVTLAKTFGIQDILGLCRAADLQTRRDAVFTIANLADTREIHDVIIKQGVIIALHQASCECGDITMQRDVARAFSCLVHSQSAHEEVLHNEILRNIFKFSQSSDILTQRFAALTLCNMSCSKSKEELVENGIIQPLLFLARFPDVEVERCASLAMAGLALGSFGNNKLRLLQAGGLAPLLGMLEFPDEYLQNCCLLALNSMALGEVDETKVQLVKEEAIHLLLALLKTSGDDVILGCLYLLGSLAEYEVRESLVGLGCIPAVVIASKIDNIEVKRAAGYFFALLAEQSEFHKELEHHGALEAIINIASTADCECQEYGCFALVHISGNREYQLQLARMGAVRPCVSLMTTNAESKHYAALALLRLADNFENHLIIAEQGGIQALLRLGRSRVVNEEVHYRAAITVGNLASNAMKTLDKRSAELKEKM